jgi:hypothetical protein
MHHRFGGWLFWLIALVPWLRAGDIIPGLVAGDPFNLGKAILDIVILLIGVTLLVGRFAQPAAELSLNTLAVRIFPFLPSQSFELSEIAGINWLSGSTLGLKIRHKGDVSVSLMMIAKSVRNALVQALSERLSSPSAA